MATTLKDVAALAGVSPMTVSKVLNNARYVREETRQRVQAAMVSLNYQPSLYASTLRNKRSQTIGILSEQPLVYEYVASALTGILDYVSEAGLSALVSEADDTRTPVQVVADRFRRRHVDGVVYIGGSGRPTKAFADTFALGVPHVYLWAEPAVRDGAVVLSDDEQGAQIGTQHLLDLGHRQIAFLGGRDDSRVAQSRWMGFRRALEASGLQVAPDLVRNGSWGEEHGYTSVFRLSAARVEFTAIVAANDFIAAGAIQALHALGRRVPDDVAVLGFDDHTVARIIRPHLTTLAMPGREMGYEAARLLVNQQGPSGAGGQEWPRRLLPCHLIVRGSTIKR